MKKWEYQVMNFGEKIDDIMQLNHFLNDSGYDGWELASIIPQGSEDSEKGRSVIIVMKREDIED